MAKKIEINTIQLVRQIRDEHSRKLFNKTHQEIIEFYKNRADAVKSRLQETGGKRTVPA